MSSKTRLIMAWVLVVLSVASIIYGLTREIKLYAAKAAVSAEEAVPASSEASDPLLETDDPLFGNDPLLGDDLLSGNDPLLGDDPLLAVDDVDDPLLGDDLLLGDDPLFGADDVDLPISPASADAAADAKAKARAVLAAQEAASAITGGLAKAYEADTSTHTLVRGWQMVKFATVGGVARTDGLLHQTGINACPT